MSGSYERGKIAGRACGQRYQEHGFASPEQAIARAEEMVNADPSEYRQGFLDGVREVLQG